MYLANSLFFDRRQARCLHVSRIGKFFVVRCASAKPLNIIKRILLFADLGI